jgi:hypothetical protein
MRIIPYLAEFAVRNAVGLLAVGVLATTGFWWGKTRLAAAGMLKGALALMSVFWVGVLVVLFANHIRFPLFLDLMEGVVYQHFQRAASFQYIYPEPSAEYVPLAYNVLYYIVAVPFSWILGESLLTLRLISILASIGIALIIFIVLRRETGSRLWGLFGAGLFAASYKVMDAYLDTAHSDSCFILCSLAGSALIYYRTTRSMRLLGLAVLVASFWFKQHGAFFAIGGVLFLTWDEGWRRSWPYWLLAALLGPVAYLFLGPSLFGSHFLFFTYQVPSAWSEISFRALLRPAGFFALSYLWLSLASAVWLVARLRSHRPIITIWQFQLLAALATALMGSLDPFSSCNVYIPFSTWIVLTGVWGLSQLDEMFADRSKDLVPSTLLILSFALLAYNPVQLLKPVSANKTYRDFIDFLGTLDGTIYAPTLGQLPTDHTFFPAAHWVALEDLVRGPHKGTQNHPMIQGLLSPLLNSKEPVYILENHLLTQWPWFEYLNDHFVLEDDLGSRFRVLKFLPGRYDHKWPRYLYRLDPKDLAQEE